jgi:hypothetical protein
LKDIGIDFLAELFAGIGRTSPQRLYLLRWFLLKEVDWLLDLLSYRAINVFGGLLSLLLLWLLFDLFLTLLILWLLFALLFALFLKEADKAPKDTLFGLGLLLHNLLGLLLNVVLDIIFS